LSDAELLSAMIPEVYEQLRDLAQDYLRGERANHTLQPTALVHEAYLRLRGQHKVDWQNRAQFLGIAAQMMRRVLKNHASARTAAKRGGQDQLRLTLDEALEFYQRSDINVAAVDEVLNELEKLDPRQAQIVELRFFGGLTIEEIAKLLQISPATVKRDWSTAKLWLQHELSSTQ
jgi:RNA polymerase sigma factor (TIGR02999 family)